MQKSLFLFAIVIFIIIQTEPAFCEVSKTITFHLSVIIPGHVIANNNPDITPFSNP